MQTDVSAISPRLEKLEIWSTTSHGFSFVISYETPSGPGFHGRTGYLASQRPVSNRRGAIRITKAACDAMLNHLTHTRAA